jgi:protease-4
MMRRAVFFSCVISLSCFFTWIAQAAPDVAADKPAASKVEKPQSQKDADSSKPASRKAKTPRQARAEEKAKAAEKAKVDEKAKAGQKAATDERTKVDAKPKTEEKPKVDAKPKAGEKKAPEKAEQNKAGKPAATAAAKKATVVCFTLKGDYREGPAPAGLFGEMQSSLGTLVQRIDAAAADKDVAAVWLKIEDLRLGRGKIYVLRAAIARLRKANKPVYAELTTADSPQYLLAVGCDQIVMPPSGMLIVPGVRAEVTFYKGLLEKLGLEFDALQMGKFKGAAEPYTRREMSKPLRESIEAIVDDTYEDLVGTIAADRKLLDFQVKSLLDHGLFTAETAKKAGLIDEVAYADQFQEQLKKKLGVATLDIVSNYKKKRIDTDFSGISGMMKFMEMLMGGKAAAETGTKPKIAVVYAVGPITEGKSASDMFGDSSMGSSTIVAALRKAAENAKVVAVVLRVDSPGGSATASDLIWRETVRMKKPVIASMSDVAGSGGYYIAMGAKKIIAAPGTMTGSIGVIGGKLVLRGLYGKVGLDTEVISRGANSSALSANQPFTPLERKAWTALLEDTYHRFVQQAADGRKMPYDKLEALAQGRVYTGRMAKRLGLIDELGTINDAIAAAKIAAGLKADAEVDLLMLPEPKSMFEQLFGDPSASADLESLLPECFKILWQAKTLRQMLSEPMLLWMPYDVQLK